MSGQLHAPDALPVENKDRGIYQKSGRVGPRGDMEVVAKNTSLLLSNIYPLTSGLYRPTLMTQLPPARRRRRRHHHHHHHH